MKRYWFELTDEHYNDLGAAISDGWQKSPAIAEAKRVDEGKRSEGCHPCMQQHGDGQHTGYDTYRRKIKT